MSRRKCFALFASSLLAISIVIGGCAPKSLVSTSQEVQIGEEASKSVEHQYRVDPNPALEGLVNDLGQTLVKCSDRQNIKYTFKVLDTNDVNAFSLPGGWVYVYKGLIDQTHGRQDELAGVIAHEIGHIVHRHHADMIGRQEYAAILVGTLTRGQVQNLAGVFADVSLLHFSREHEYEADMSGIKEMYRCEKYNPKVYNPQGLVDFFNTLLKLEGHRPSAFAQIFQTHPVTANRIQKAQAYLADLRAGKVDP